MINTFDHLIYFFFSYSLNCESSESEFRTVTHQIITCNQGLAWVISEDFSEKSEGGQKTRVWDTHTHTRMLVHNILKAFQETDPEACPRNPAAQPQRGHCVHDWETGRSERERGRQTLPTYSRKGRNMAEKARRGMWFPQPSSDLWSNKQRRSWFSRIRGCVCV